MRWMLVSGLSVLAVCACGSSGSSTGGSTTSASTGGSTGGPASASTSAASSASNSSAAGTTAGTTAGGATSTGGTSGTGTSSAGSSTGGISSSSGATTGTSTGLSICAHPTFVLLPVSSVGGMPDGLTVADFNGDQLADFVVTSYAKDSLTLFLNPGDGGIDGGFGAGVVFDGGVMPRRPAAANLTDDRGAPSLIVPDYSPFTGELGGPLGIYSNTGVWTNGGDAGLSSPAEYATPTETCPGAVAVADLNKDGWPDLIFTDSCFRQLGVFLSLGDGGFASPQTITLSEDLGDLAIGDLNGDGWPDVVAISAVVQGVVVFTNTQDWSTGAASGFATAVTYTDQEQATSVAIADLNGDGLPDVIVTNQLTSKYAGGSVGVFLNTPDAGLSPQLDFKAGDLPQNVAIGDINGDGLPDVVTAGDTGPAIFFNTGVWGSGGDGGLTAPFAQFSDAGIGADTVSLVDYNNDGWLDIVMSLGDEIGSAGVFINTCGQ